MIFLFFCNDHQKYYKIQTPFYFAILLMEISYIYVIHVNYVPNMMN